MTEPLVPAELGVLRRPWTLSDHDVRHVEVGRLADGPARRAEALAALAACLNYLASTAEHRSEVPEGFEDHWFVLADGFFRRMPELNDVTTEAVTEWLAAEGEDLEPGVVARFWVGSFVPRITDELIGWLTAAVRESPDRAGVVALLEAAAPRLPWRRGIVAVGAVRDLGDADALRRIGDDPRTPDRTRAEAAAAVRFLDRHPR